MKRTSSSAFSPSIDDYSQTIKNFKHDSQEINIDSLPKDIQNGIWAIEDLRLKTLQSVRLVSIKLAASIRDFWIDQFKNPNVDPLLVIKDEALFCELLGKCPKSDIQVYTASRRKTPLYLCDLDQKFPNLVRVSLQYCSIKDKFQDLETKTLFKSLKFLDLTGCKQKNLLKRAYSSAQDFEQRATNKISMTSINFKFLENCPSLQLLNLTHCDYIEASLNSPTDKQITVIKGGDETQYEGIFVNGRIKDNSEATLTYRNGTKYTGTFNNGILEKGRVVTNRGWIYEGNFSNTGHFGQKNILLKTPNGDTYEGELNDYWQFQGKGTMINSLGIVFKGYFIAGDLKHGTITYLDGNQYEGEILDWRPHGLGRLYNNGRIIHEGRFENGIPDKS